MVARELGVREVVAPVLQAFDRGEELGVMDVVIPFRGRREQGIETERMQDAIGIGLAADGTKGCLRGVRLEEAGLGGIEMDQDRGRS